MSEPKYFLRAPRIDVSGASFYVGTAGVVIGISDCDGIVVLSVDQARTLHDFLNRVLPSSEARRDPTEAFDGGRPG